MFDLASVLNQAETIDLALLYDRFALALRPQFPLAQLLLADILSAQNKPEQSLAVLGRDPAGLALLLVGAAARRDQSRDARPHRRGDREVEDNGGGRRRPVGAEMQLGDMLRNKKRFAEAVDAYDEAIQRSAAPACRSNGRCSTTAASRSSAPGNGSGPRPICSMRSS